MGGQWGFLVLPLMLSASIVGEIGAVEVKVDFYTSLYTNGQKSFDRVRFVNAHGNSATSSNAKRLMEYVMDELGVSFGRSANEAPLGATNFPHRIDRMKTDGAHKVKIVTCPKCDNLRKRFITKDRIVVDKASALKKLYKSESMIQRAVSTVPDYFTFFFNERAGYPEPKYYECFNEVLIKWRQFKRYPNETERSVVRRIGEICGRLCKAVSRKHPSVLVGGPSASSARPFLNDFERFRNTKEFVEQAQRSGCLDFFSEHVYNTGGAAQDANLDLLESYTYKRSTGPRKAPLKYLISESSSYEVQWFPKDKAAPPRGGRDFRIVTEAFKVLMSTLRVHDNVLKLVTFLTLDPNDRRNQGKHRYPWSLSEGGPHGKVKATPLLYFFELLRGVEGDFVYSSSDEPDVKVHAVANSDKGYILLQNMDTSRSYDVNIKLPFGVGKVEKVVERRIWLAERALAQADIAQNLRRAGQFMWRNTTLPTIPQSVPLKPEAMTILELTFSRPMAELRTVSRTRHYASDVKNRRGDSVEAPVKIGRWSRTTFLFDDLPGGMPDAVARVRVSHSRSIKMSPKPAVIINGIPVPDYDPGMSGPKPSFSRVTFGTFVIEIPLRTLKRRSPAEVTLDYSDAGGKISSVVIEVDECKGNVCCLMANSPGYEPCKFTAIDSDQSKTRPIPNSGQRLKDPSFEGEAAEWKFEGTARVATWQRFNGDQSLEIRAPLGRAKQWVFLKEKTLYRLRCVVKGELDMLVGTVGTVYAENLKDTDPIGGSPWRSQELDFWNEVRGSYQVTLVAKPRNAARVFVDSCTIYKSTEVPPFVGSENVQASR
uniref:Uncharacterized protein n=1 Tax=Rhodosorus marinus TaxID=101924 RepID=A0A7S2ZNA9_9RHOD|mmetsp:Transcript_26049/g.102316  ORF Transcript_26049/g.102316 Transcript_26049/m.102316 type:complete len:824 (+) Transcript_26049:123-2594(+)